ncbi:hypothetical protein [Mariniphaga sp.]|uniref:hypothetical protein n=1 Tax=Mariniphaga sp. TaxID=1954475 RepID=UPI003561436C
MSKTDYYHLIELPEIVNLKYRQLQKRLKIVIEKYESEKDKLFKKSNRWYIHKSIVEKEFSRNRNLPPNYKLFITITTQIDTNSGYWRVIINEINKKLKEIDNSYRIKYVIESKNHRQHLHFITDCDKRKELKIIFKKIPELIYLNKVNIDITTIYDEKKLQNYFKKQNKPILLPK